MADPNKIELFLDSGAYSAWSKGAEIDIDKYINFIKEHNSRIDYYSNLDVIGSAEATWRNQKKMERAGLTPLPTFHYGEEEKWLKRYMDNYEYICLGGMVPISTKPLIQWLDRLFDQYICDDSGFPKVKVHGFGLTTLKLMSRYPWYSVDSSSFIVISRMGSIYVPQRKGGKWRYDLNPWKIVVSQENPTVREKGKHFSNLSPTEQQIVLDYIHELGFELGKTEFKTVPSTYKLKDNEKWIGSKPKEKGADRQVKVIIEKGVSNDYKLRDACIIRFWHRFEAAMPIWPWQFILRSKHFSL